MYFLTIFASESFRIMVPDASRMNFVVRLIMPWRLPATPAFTRPEAVKLKRFFAADLVFILGISISMVAGVARHAKLAGNTGYSKRPYRRVAGRVQGVSAGSCRSHARKHGEFRRKYSPRAFA